MNNSTLKTIGIAALSSVVTVFGYNKLGLNERDVIFNESSSPALARLANLPSAPSGVPGDFTYAAEISTPAVVHIKATATRAVRQQMPSIFGDLFGMDDMFGGPRSQQQESSGSGVIITNDGYIATNNHVVEGAEELEVVLSDKKSYKATVVGTDPSTDIAVIKVDVDKLPAITFGNSDNAKVGEWVLAVGNPFNLESTVTAGIISAIGRDISILKDKYAQNYQRTGKPTTDTPIESFIQTDAAVNPGNSGGALVNLRGELIGINTAIASPNGAYAGYAFAVPSSIVKKVTADIIKFGNVQRGYVGIQPKELNNKIAQEIGIKQFEGIYVEGVSEASAAKEAGIKKGDVIIKVDGIDTKSEPKFREMIGRKRPGENVRLTINRDGVVKDFDVTLRNREGGKEFVKKADEATMAFNRLGVELEEIPAADKQKMGLSNGLKVKKVFDGDISNYTDIREGFIITKVGDKKVNTVKDFKEALSDAQAAGEDGVLICGVYKGVARNYCYGLTLP